MFIDKYQFLCESRGLKPRPLILEQHWGSKNTFESWKNGKQPSVEIAIKICAYFNVSLDYIFLDKDTDTTLPDDEQELLSLYRTYKTDIGQDKALHNLKDVIPQRRIKCHQDKVSAGTGVDLESSICKPILIYGSDIANEANFTVIVSGESMSPEYHNGDILLIKDIEHTHEPDVGQNGIFVINDSLGYVKQWQRNKDGEYYLKSLNPQSKDIHFSDGDQVVCKGIVIGKAISLEQE